MKYPTTFNNSIKYVMYRRILLKKKKNPNFKSWESMESSGLSFNHPYLFLLFL